VQLFQLSYVVDNQQVTTNVRHYESFVRAREALLAARAVLTSRRGEEKAAFEIRDAIAHLGAIIGEITDDEVLGNIFGKFCVGK
jgi:tRNA modification GTPase